MSKIPYTMIGLKSPQKVFAGRAPIPSIEQTAEVKINRVVDEAGDNFYITGAQRGVEIEIPASNVGMSIRARSVVVPIQPTQIVDDEDDVPTEPPPPPPKAPSVGLDDLAAHTARRRRKAV